ncbi:MAG: BatA domain-containing protein [Sedimentisphaerales bacterium]|nr:BatA domain-containing protein [Sedimentisphaerales bacterium]
MSFVEWIFLLGGLAVAGPVIAHLLAKPRFRRVPFTMLRFLRTGQIESQSRRKLRDLLILLLRCAIIVLIAMLFAQPILHIRPKPQRTRDVYFLGLDNSMSMAYRDGSGSYLDRMTASAIDYIQAAGPRVNPAITMAGSGAKWYAEAAYATVFNVCPLAAPSRLGSGQAPWQHGLSKDQALAAVKGLKVSPASAKMSEFLSAVGLSSPHHYLRGGPKPTLHEISRNALSGDVIHVLLASDFTPNTLKQLFDVQEPAKAHNIDYKPIVSPEPINNAAIIEAHASEAVGDRIGINVTVANYGQTEQNRRLTAKVKTSASESVLAEVSLSPNQQRVYQGQIDIGISDPFDKLRAGRGQASVPIELSLSPGDGLREDDTFYLAISTPQHKTLTVILAGPAANQMFLVGTALDTLSRMDSHGGFKIRQLLLNDLASADLGSADILICSAITEPLGRMASALRSFMLAGGRIIFFITGEPALSAMQQLWQQDVLPALPRKYVTERVYVEPKPLHQRALAVDSLAAEALSNYKIDNIAFKGCWQCEVHPQTRCLWKFKNGVGFVYLKSIGDGVSILVNTSADDSLGSLTKSSASVAFCRYLLGANNQVSENSFAYGEPVVLSLPSTEASSAQRQLWIETCDAQKHRVALSLRPFDLAQGTPGSGQAESSLLVPDPGGIGWVKTLGKPAIYAGVNVPQGETDMAKPASKEVAEVMSRVFSRDTERGVASAEAFSDKKQRPLWKAFAWTLIFLLLLEPAIANRLKR